MPTFICNKLDCFIFLVISHTITDLTLYWNSIDSWQRPVLCLHWLLLTADLCLQAARVRCAVSSPGVPSSDNDVCTVGRPASGGGGGGGGRRADVGGTAHSHACFSAGACRTSSHSRAAQPVPLLPCHRQLQKGEISMCRVCHS